MRASFRNSVILGVVAFATVVSSAWAVNGPLSIVYFPNDSNRLVGDPRRGTDEIYLNTAVNTYLNPANILGGAPVTPVGSQVPGQIESLRSVAGVGLTGINIPQPCDVSGVPSDPRSGLINPDNAPPYGGAGQVWGVRAGVAMQWQTVQDGSTNFLMPAGVNSGQGYNLTPRSVYSVVLGLNPVGVPTIVIPADDGLAPGSVAADGVSDFVPWVRDISTGQLITGFGLNFWDANAAAAAGFDAAGILALTPRLDVYEGGALFDQVLGAFDAQNFNHNGGTNGIAGDELNDAVDGTLLLSGSLVDVQVENTWTANLLGIVNGQFVADPTTVRRTIKVKGTVIWDYNDPSILLDPENRIGTFSANWNGINFTNIDVVTGGTHQNVSAYDFVGDSITSYDGSVTFQAIPEPLTMVSGVLALCGLGGYIRRRR